MITAPPFKTPFLLGAQMSKVNLEKALNELLSESGSREAALRSSSNISLNEAQALMARSVAQIGNRNRLQKFIPFASDALERNLFRILHENQPDLLDKYKDSVKALLLAKVYYAPLLCRSVLIRKNREGKIGSLCMADLCAYSVAFERVMLERLFSAFSSQPDAHDLRNEMRHAVVQSLKGRKFMAKAIEGGDLNAARRLYDEAYEAARLENPLIFKKWDHWIGTTFGDSCETWFDNCPEPHVFWLWRFQQWRDYALRSVEYFFRKQSIDYRRARADLKAAALIGVFELLGYASNGFCKDLLFRLSIGEAGWSVFKKVSKKKPTTPPSLEFDTWLIECWPLVRGYGWNYADLQILAEKRFTDDKYAKWLDSADALKDRCVKLKLILSSGGQDKIGRPKTILIQNDRKRIDPPLFQLGMMIDSIGGSTSEWFFGNTDAGFKCWMPPGAG
jgi:hypothetical protein